MNHFLQLPTDVKNQARNMVALLNRGMMKAFPEEITKCANEIQSAQKNIMAINSAAPGSYSIDQRKCLLGFYNRRIAQNVSKLNQYMGYSTSLHEIEVNSPQSISAQ